MLVGSKYSVWSKDWYSKNGGIKLISNIISLKWGTTWLNIIKRNIVNISRTLNNTNDISLFH